MAKINQLARLFHALSSRDWASAREVAERIIESEQQTGHHVAATTLRGALANTGPMADTGGMEPDRGAVLVGIPEVVTAVNEPRKLESVELLPRTRALIESLCKEHLHRDILRKHGLDPRRRIFFHGPPGCGKTLTAKAIATELNVPLFVVRFDALVGAYLGQTSARVREVFRFAEQQPAVVLIDEIDAIGRRRGNVSDVGELDRVVISLMQQLDLAQPAGMLIAASNIPKALDPALLRRFDATIEFRAPSKARIERFARREAARRGVKLQNGTIQELSQAKTYADAERVIMFEQRRLVLQRV